jgi:hypothetical protein
MSSASAMQMKAFKSMLQAETWTLSDILINRDPTAFLAGFCSINFSFPTPEKRQSAKLPRRRLRRNQRHFSTNVVGSGNKDMAELLRQHSELIRLVADCVIFGNNPKDANMG